MNNKISQSNKYESDLSVVDEGWWDSILAEERRFGFDTDQNKDLNHKHSSSEHIQPFSAKVVNWTKVKQYFEQDLIIDVKVVGRNVGGLLVDGGEISGFVPFSHLLMQSQNEMENEREKSLSVYEGTSINVKIIEYDPQKERVIFSERAAQFSSGKRTEIFENLTKGMRVIGRVTNITDFGVFIDIGGVEGLVHVSEMSWGRVSNLKDFVNLGDEIEVQVLDIFPERNRVALSKKRLLSNPWDDIAKFSLDGYQLTATISKIMSFGVFARLDSGVEGLIHSSELDLAPGQTPKDVYSLDQQVQVRILHLDAQHQRIGFTLKSEIE